MIPMDLAALVHGNLGRDNDGRSDIVFANTKI